jgi:hypothetical protein
MNISKNESKKIAIKITNDNDWLIAFISNVITYLRGRNLKNKLFKKAQKKFCDNSEVLVTKTISKM